MDTQDASAIAGSIQLVALGWKFNCSREAETWVVLAEKGETFCRGAGRSIGEAFLRAETDAMAMEFGLAA